MSSVRAIRGPARVASPRLIVAPVTSIRDEVREVALHVKEAAELALVAAGGDEYEHGIEYLLDTLADLAPRLDLLRQYRAAR